MQHKNERALQFEHPAGYATTHVDEHQFRHESSALLDSVEDALIDMAASNNQHPAGETATAAHGSPQTKISDTMRVQRHPDKVCERIRDALGAVILFVLCSSSWSWASKLGASS